MNSPILLNDLPNDGLVVLENYYSMLKIIEDYTIRRQKYLDVLTPKEIWHITNIQRLELLNQNVISTIENNKDIFKKAETYLQKYHVNDHPKEVILFQDEQKSNIMTVEITGDTAVMTGSNIKIPAKAVQQWHFLTHYLKGGLD